MRLIWKGNVTWIAGVRTANSILVRKCVWKGMMWRLSTNEKVRLKWWGNKNGTCDIWCSEMAVLCAVFSHRYPARKVLCAWYCRAFKMYCLNVNKIMLSLHCDIWWCLKRVYNTGYCVSIFHAVAYRRWEVLWDVVLCCVGWWRQGWAKWKPWKCENKQTTVIAL